MKTYTKGAKKRAKKALPGLADVPRKYRNGRTKQAPDYISDKDPTKTALEGRTRQMGITPGDLKDMRAQALGEAAGRAIYTLREGDTAKALWAAYEGLTAAEARYLRHYLGLRIHAKTAKVEYLLETFETRPDDRPDLRTDEERSKDAANAWARWRGYLMHLPQHKQSIIMQVAYGTADPMDAGQITANGHRFVEAIEALAKVVEAKR